MAWNSFQTAPVKHPSLHEVWHSLEAYHKMLQGCNHTEASQVVPDPWVEGQMLGNSLGNNIMQITESVLCNTGPNCLFIYYCVSCLCSCDYDVEGERCGRHTEPSVLSGGWGSVQKPHGVEDESDRAAVPCQSLRGAERWTTAEVDGLHRLLVW